MAEVKIEIGVMTEDGSTVWPAEFRTYAKPDQFERAFAHVLMLAGSEIVTGIRTTRTEEGESDEPSEG